jgi:hypothetical protein
MSVDFLNIEVVVHSFGGVKIYCDYNLYPVFCGLSLLQDFYVVGAYDPS